MSCLIPLAQSNDQLSDILQYAREYLSYGYWGLEDLLVIRNSFNSQREHIEKILGVWEFASLIRWPNQSLFEAWMGYLFFPLQYEYMSEWPGLLKIRKNLQYLLAISASYKYLPAIYYTSAVLEDFTRKESDDALQPADLVEKFFGKQPRQLIESCLHEPSAANVLPPYFAGIVCEEEFEPDKAALWFQEGTKRSDDLCTYLCARASEDAGEREKHIFNLSQSKNSLSQGLALLVEASHNDSDEKAIEAYRMAGDLGCVEGYLEAGDKCRHSKNQELRNKCHEFYTQAAQNNVLVACTSLANHYLEQYDALKENNPHEALRYRELAKNWLYFAANKGDHLVFYKLKDLFRQEKNYEKERICWENAQRSSGTVETLRRLVNHENI